MLTFNSNIETKFDSEAELAGEFRHKFPNYKVNPEVDIEGYDILIKFCVIIPVGNMHILIEVEKIDNNGQIHFNVFGMTEDIELTTRHLLLAEVSIFNNQIINIKDIMKMADFRTDGNMVSLENNFDSHAIHNICVSFLNYFFCRRFFSAHDDTYLDGDMLLDY